ncbi:hypothetical protein [Fibrella aquatilis]|uniref:Uncharacterized protein n=1 Tax=Fibrella aquatilis TaxID=2817059 RepID=A0A939G619_9BACT|nr:hypothetical protein [Fibrella aquatilis]MBO0930453.1 hypothetical protein [Fibrella aquatilis]
MKKLFLLTTLLFISVACQTESDKSLSVADSETPSLFTDADLGISHHRSFVEVRLSAAALCPGMNTLSCRKELHRLHRQVAEDYPIPVPQPNVPPLISAEEATVLYKKYLTVHANAPILVVFKQLYPRILLNRYGILASNHHKQILYFTEHMIEAHSQDFATLAKALPLLQNDIPRPVLGGWLTTLIPEAEAQERTVLTGIAELKAALGQKQPEKFTFERLEAMANQLRLADMETNTISADVVTLRKLRQAAIQ